MVIKPKAIEAAKNGAPRQTSRLVTLPRCHQTRPSNTSGNGDTAVLLNSASTNETRDNELNTRDGRGEAEGGAAGASGVLRVACCVLPDAGFPLPTLDFRLWTLDSLSDRK